jgi:peptidoglycan hydrolase CwlO-like protein
MTPKEWAEVLIGFLRQHTATDVHPALGDVAEYVATVQGELDAKDAEIDKLRREVDGLRTVTKIKTLRYDYKWRANVFEKGRWRASVLKKTSAEYGDSILEAIGALIYRHPEKFNIEIVESKK